MARRRSVEALLAALAVAVGPALGAWGCGASSGPGTGADAGSTPADGAFAPACEIPDWVWYDWRMDGNPGALHCLPADSRSETSASGSGLERQVIFLSGLDALLGDPACKVSIEFYNRDLTTDASGDLTPMPPAVFGTTSVVLGMSYLRPADGDVACIRATGEAFAESGHWHVIQGGTWGQVVDVEATDVTFPLLEGGHTMHFDRMRWHVTLREPIRYP